MRTDTFHPQPQFKELKFKNNDEFNKWLNATAVKIIWLEDKGQDLTALWVASTGEVLHTNLQQAVWNGTFIDLDMLKPGENIVMYLAHHREWRTMLKLECEKIENLK